MPKILSSVDDTATAAEVVEEGSRREPSQVSAPALDDRSLYINREISWLAFNERVLRQALSPRWPLLERLKFLAIFASNLDEFFMIRVSGLHEQLEAAVIETSPDGLSPGEQLAEIGNILRRQLEVASKLLSEELLPGLAAAGHPLARLGVAGRRDQEAGPALFPALGLPGADPARRRSRPPVSVPVEPVAVAGGGDARPRHRREEVRARQGAGEPAALRAVRESGRRAAPRTYRSSCRSSSSSPRTSAISFPAWRSSAAIRSA